MSRFNIRAHHGLCISFFEGKGYSDDFTSNMAKTIALLEENPVIRVLDGADEICRACPNNLNGVCSSSEKVGRYDNAVLSLCGIESGTEISWEDFRRLVSESIISKNKLAEVCGDCQWFDICAIRGKSFRGKR